MVAINHDLDHLDASAGHESVLHKLVIRQQPKRSRVGCISERVDRRPVDPPPIIQLVMDKQSQGAGTDPDEPSYTLSPHFIMRATLVDKDDEKEISRIRGDTVPALSGMVVSSLHTLCDLDMVQGAYFVFGDLSVRLEGSFKLRNKVVHRTHVVSGPFTVYSPKRFPGMMGSSLLARAFAGQGLRIRIRSDIRPRKRGNKDIQQLKNVPIAKIFREDRADSDTSTIRSSLSYLDSISPSSSVDWKVLENFGAMGNVQKPIWMNGAFNGRGEPGYKMINPDRMEFGLGSVPGGSGSGSGSSTNSSSSGSGGSGSTNIRNYSNLSSLQLLGCSKGSPMSNFIASSQQNTQSSVCPLPTNTSGAYRLAGLFNNWAQQPQELSHGPAPNSISESVLNNILLGGMSLDRVNRSQQTSQIQWPFSNANIDQLWQQDDLQQTRLPEGLTNYGPGLVAQNTQTTPFQTLSAAQQLTEWINSRSDRNQLYK